jgi:hypothetical protein
VLSRSTKAFEPRLSGWSRLNSSVDMRTRGVPDEGGIMVIFAGAGTMLAWSFRGTASYPEVSLVHRLSPGREEGWFLFLGHD